MMFIKLHRYTDKTYKSGISNSSPDKAKRPK